MPNIEIFGFSWPDQSHAYNLVNKIRGALKGASYLSDVVITHVASTSINDKHETQRFLRIWTTGQDEQDDIVKRLDPLDIDIELPPLLDKFILRKSERDKLVEKLKGLRPVAGSDPDFDYGKEKTSNVQETVDRAAENLKRDLGPYPVTQSKMLE